MEQQDNLNDYSQMTYIKAPSNEPVGLDMSQFGVENKYSQAEKVDIDDLSILEQDIISGCMERHGTFNSVM
jgi:hypothetical protein